MLKRAGVWCAVGVWLCAVLSARVQSAVLYETGFEANEGFNIEFDLAGQGNWMVEGTGGNGLVDEFFEGFGQQAYIGFVQPAQGSATSVWRPVNFTPDFDGRFTLGMGGGCLESVLRRELSRFGTRTKTLNSIRPGFHSILRGFTICTSGWISRAIRGRCC